VQAIPEDALGKLVRGVARSEGVPITATVGQKIIELAEGSARKALVLLNALIGIEDEDTQLGILQVGDFKATAIEIARALANNGTTWKQMAAILKGIDYEKEDIEGLRHMVMGYASAILLNGADNRRAAIMLYYFSKNFYDTKKNGLILACYDTLHAK
jgi:DNA polymerase III delta prime subunit